MSYNCDHKFLRIYFSTVHNYFCKPKRPCYMLVLVLIFTILELFHSSIFKVVFDSFYLIYILTSTEDRMVLSLKTHRQIFEKQCFEKYWSCDKVCQVSALYSIFWESYFKKLAIGNKYRISSNKRRTSNNRRRLISASFLGIHIEVSASL